jgi:hypothetical protein
MSKLRDDGLPEELFTSTPSLPPPRLTPEEELRQRQLEPDNPEIARAEALCQAGDVPAALAAIKQLLQKDTYLGKLQCCILAAIVSGSTDIVRLLLDSGLWVNVPNTKAAIEYKRIPILDLFLQHGWDINEDEAWCGPPALLGYVISILTTNPC